MTCFLPLPACYSGKLTKKGLIGIDVFRRTESNLSKYSMRVPCGQCIGCRLDYSREWAVRCMHEASLYEYGRGNCFITLTYNKDFLPENKSINYRHWSLFLKRLRKRFGAGIRFYMGPEYGDLNGRPHYHALLFNFKFDDQVLHSVRNGYRLFTSKVLDSLWSDPESGLNMGFASVGTVTFESAAYVARYMMKKVKGDDQLLRYFTQIDQVTGEIIPIEPEKARMSRMPGIAKSWFDTFSSEIYPSDEVVLPNGAKCKTPRYYDKILKELDPLAFEAIKATRISDAESRAWNSTESRLSVRAKCKEMQLKSLPRLLD